MQAIQTKYMQPTSTKCARIKAWCEAGSIIIPYDYIDEYEIHRAAAYALRDKLGWVPPHYGDIVGGSLPGNDGYAFVFLERSK